MDKKTKIIVLSVLFTGLFAVVLAIFLPGVIARLKLRNVARIISEENEAKAAASIRDSFSVREMNIMLGDSASPAILKLRFDLAYPAGDVLLYEELLQRHAEIHYSISNLIADRSIGDIDEETEKNALKKEIVSRINSILTNGQIDKVYFDEFLFLIED